jgi:hypothetical protein
MKNQRDIQDRLLAEAVAARLLGKGVHPLTDMIGKTVCKVEGGAPNDDTVDIHFTDNTVARFYHDQDCCESVSIEDVTGDWSDLIGEQILSAYESSSDGESDRPFWDGKPEEEFKTGDDSYTWTFYHFTSRKGSVSVRWYGASNGYYSESVTYSMGTES